MSEVNLLVQEKLMGHQYDAIFGYDDRPICPHIACTYSHSADGRCKQFQSTEAVN